MSEQPTNKPAPEQPGNKTSSGLSENLVGLLCYAPFIGWIASIIFLITEKDNKLVRFNAIQALGLGIVFYILVIIPILGWILYILGIVLMIILMIKAYQGKMFKLPIIGNFAAKQAGL